MERKKSWRKESPVMAEWEQQKLLQQIVFSLFLHCFSVDSMYREQHLKEPIERLFRNRALLAQELHCSALNHSYIYGERDSGSSEPRTTRFGVRTNVSLAFRTISCPKGFRKLFHAAYFSICVSD